MKTGLLAKPIGSSSHQIRHTAQSETIAQPKVLVNIGFWYLSMNRPRWYTRLFSVYWIQGKPILAEILALM